VKTFVQPSRPELTVWRMPIVYWIRKATNTYTEYVILIFFSTRMVARTRLNVAPYVYCLSFLSKFLNASFISSPK
jgi:hypothetical protein